MKIQGRYTIKGQYGVWTITDTKTGAKSDYFDGVYRNERGIWADANAVNGSFAHNLREAGLS